MKWSHPKAKKVQTSSFHQNTLASSFSTQHGNVSCFNHGKLLFTSPFQRVIIIIIIIILIDSHIHTTNSYIATLAIVKKSLLCPTSNHSIPSSFLCFPFLAKALSCCQPHHVFGRVTQGWQEEGCHRWRRGGRNGQQFTKSSNHCFSLTLSTVLRCHPRTASGKIQDHHHRAHVRSRRSGNIYTPQRRKIWYLLDE